jgi:hypothetical protein
MRTNDMKEAGKRKILDMMNLFSLQIKTISHSFLGLMMIGIKDLLKILLK